MPHSLKVLVGTLTKNPPSDPRQDTTPSGKVRAAPVPGTYMYTPYSLCEYPHAAHSPQIACSGALPPSFARRHARLGGSLNATEEWNSASPATRTLYCRERREREKEKESWVSPASLPNTAQTLARPVSLRRGGESSLDAPLIRCSAILAVLRTKQRNSQAGVQPLCPWEPGPSTSATQRRARLHAPSV